MSLIWDTDGIGARLAQLRGERPNGTYYVKQPDGGYANQPRHEINLADRCVRCGATAIDIEDSIVPAFCTGRIDGEACIHCGARAVVPSGRDQVMCIACRVVSYRDEPGKTFVEEARDFRAIYDSIMRDLPPIDMSNRARRDLTRSIIDEAFARMKVSGPLLAPPASVKPHRLAGAGLPQPRPGEWTEVSDLPQAFHEVVVPLAERVKAAQAGETRVRPAARSADNAVLVAVDMADGSAVWGAAAEPGKAEAAEVHEAQRAVALAREERDRRERQAARKRLREAQAAAWFNRQQQLSAYTDQAAHPAKEARETLLRMQADVAKHGPCTCGRGVACRCCCSVCEVA